MTSIAVENIEDYKAEIRKKTSKPLLWIGMGSIVMFFGGWTSAVVVSKEGGGVWLDIDMPFAFTISTAIIVLSSVIFHFGLASIKQGKVAVLKKAVLVTLFLGLGFVLTQFLGWRELYQEGIVATGSQSTNASSYFYVLTFFHVLHLLGGLISLAIVLAKAIRGRYNADNYLGVQLSITYWHFLGALWIYLFFFLRYIA